MAGGSSVVGTLKVILGLDTAEFEAGSKKAQQKSSELDQMLGGIGKTIAAAFTVQKIVTFGASIFDAASQIHDMSAALGFSAEAFQRNKYAVEQSGGSVEAFQKAAQRLNAALGDGSKSTIQALKNAGLQFEKIRAMKPEDAWAAVTKAVGEIQDPLTRAHVAQELFGKGALTLLPGMIEGYEDLGKAATVMSNETVERLEAAQDSWEAFWNKVTIISGEAIGFVMNIEKKAHDERIKNIALMSQAEKEELARLEASNAVYLRGADYATEYAKALAKMLPASKDIALSHHEHEAVVVELTEAQKKAKAEQDRWTASVQAFTKTLTGGDIAEELKKIDQAVKAAGGASKLTAFQLDDLGKKLLELERRGGTIPPTLEAIALKASRAQLDLRLLNGAVMTGGVEASIAVPKWAALAKSFTDTYVKTQDVDKAFAGLGVTITHLEPPPIDPWQKWHDAAMYFVDGVSYSIARGFTDVLARASSFGEAMSNIWQGIKDSFFNVFQMMLDNFINGFLKGLLNGIGTAKLGETVGNSLKSFGAKMLGGLQSLLSGGIASMFAVAIPLVIAGISKLAGLFKGEGAKTNDDRDIWMARLGGFEGSREILAQYPELIPSFEKAYHASDRDTFAPAAAEFNALANQLGVPGFKWGTGGQFMDFGAGTLAMLHGQEMITPKPAGGDLSSAFGGGMMTIILEQDGRAAARFIAPWLPGEVKRLQLAR